MGSKNLRFSCEIKESEVKESGIKKCGTKEYGMKDCEQIIPINRMQDYKNAGLKTWIAQNVGHKIRD